MKIIKLLLIATSLSALSLSCGNVIGGAIEAAKQAKLDPAPQPSFSLPGGIYTNAEELILSSSVAGARIRYTNDGSSPSETNGLSYSGPILLTASQTIKAICLADGYNKSAIAQEDYEITGTVAVPTFSHEAGNYNGRQHVVLSSITSDVTIYYTTDGTNPTESSAVYAEPIEVFDDTQIKAKAVRNYWLDSPINSASYEISYTVQFDLQGSSATAIPARSTIDYQAFVGAAPAIPQDNQAYFDGWYKESGCINAWNFSVDVVENNTTLFAKWQHDIVSPNIGRLKYVPPGRFQRDATATNISALTKPVYFAEHEVTRAQFLYIMGSDPSNPAHSSTLNNGQNDPVQMVNWFHAITFCNKLSLAEGLTPVYLVSGVNFASLTFAGVPQSDSSAIDLAKWSNATANWNANGYRLPTEMEWMWAAMGAPRDGQKGGTNTSGYTKAFAGSNGSNIIGDFAVFGSSESPKNLGQTTADKSNPVGSKNANELRIFDLSGNVGEWCWDLHSVYPSNISIDYKGVSASSHRVRRGSSHLTPSASVVISFRYNSREIDIDRTKGFRVVRN